MRACTIEWPCSGVAWGASSSTMMSRMFGFEEGAGMGGLGGAYGGRLTA